MADIELVIKMPEEMYKWVNDANKFFDDYGISDFIDLVKNGTPLPKGHGKLKDINKIYNRIDALNRSEEYKGKYTGVLAILTMADTIIEADIAEREE